MPVPYLLSSYAFNRGQQGVPRSLRGRLDGLCTWLPSRKGSSSGDSKSGSPGSKGDSTHLFGASIDAALFCQSGGSFFFCGAVSSRPPRVPPRHGSSEDRGKALVSELRSQRAIKGGERRARNAIDLGQHFRRRRRGPLSTSTSRTLSLHFLPKKNRPRAAPSSSPRRAPGPPRALSTSSEAPSPGPPRHWATVCSCLCSPTEGTPSSRRRLLSRSGTRRPRPRSPARSRPL